MSEYRSIAPSANAGPKHSSSPDGAAPPRRRRVTGQVSQLACNECRRTRSKCDGERPHRCGRCAARGLTCIYEPHTKTQKGDLLRELQHAQAREKNLQESNMNSSIILQIITNDGHVDEVIRLLQSGSTQQQVVDWLRTLDDVRDYVEKTPAIQDGVADVVARIERLFTMPTSPGTIADPDASKWTNVTGSIELLQHLLQLYFTWVHPQHLLFSEFDMLESFYHGQTLYCSPVLVNAICAMACHLVDAPSSSPGTPQAVASLHFSQAHDMWELQKAFVREARGYLKPHYKLDMLALQALCILALNEFSNGSARAANSYLRCAADQVAIGVKHAHGPVHPKYDRWIASVSRCGIQALNIIWSGLTYQSDCYSGPPAEEIDAPETVNRINNGQWHAYKHRGDETTMPRQPGFAALTARHQASLAKATVTLINLYSGGFGRFHPSNVIDVYRNFISWRKALPEPLQGPFEEQTQPLPHVFSLHVYYHTCLIQLWAPLKHANLNVDGSASDEVQAQLMYHSRQGMSLVDKLHRSDLTRYTMPTVAFCICHLGEVIIQYGTEYQERMHAVRLCLDVLDRNRAGFQVCGPLSQIFRTSAAEAGLDLESLPDNLKHGEEFDIDQILDCTTRLSYAQPIKRMCKWMHKDFRNEWRHEWEKYKREEDNQKPKGLRVTDLLNG